jgi:hypothetical protein
VARSDPDREEGPVSATGAMPGEIVLGIGRLDANSEERFRNQGASLVSCVFSGLDRDLLDHLKPAGIAFSLFPSGFDAPQLIERLNDLNYRGWVCVIAPELPDRRMVERELRTFGNKVDLRIWEANSE